jgi:hypothetical protein
MKLLILIFYVVFLIKYFYCDETSCASLKNSVVPASNFLLNVEENLDCNLENLNVYAIVDI